MSYLDVRKLVSKEQTGFQVPTRCEIPDTIKSKYIDLDIKDHNHEFKKHGTLVVWKDCDNVNPQTFSFLKKRLEFELGRRFRYLIVNGDQRVFVINDGDYLNDNGYFELIPSDPSLLMTRNYILGNVEEPTKWYKNTGVPVFEPFTENHPNGEWIVDIDYIDRNDNTRKSYPVTIKSSVVKKEFYDQTAIPSGNPGQGELGKAIKKLQGISIVRAHREIDFGGFGFFNPNDKYTDRWWAIEIIFDPVLDEVFGVSNNKQHVELIKVEDDDADFDNDEMPKPLWTQLNESVKEEIRDMVKRNKDLRGGSRTQHDPTSSESAINAAEDTSPESVPTRSEEERGHSTEEQINEVAKDIAISKGINEEDIDDSIIATISNNKVNITYEAAGEFNPFFEYRSKHGVVQCVFNTDHELYKMFIEDMINSSDKTSKHCFELLFGSLVRLLDETTDDDTQRQYQKLVKRWNTKVEDYLEKLEG